MERRFFWLRSVGSKLTRAALIAALAATAYFDCASLASVSPLPAETAVLVGAGDIADCTGLSGAEATARLLDHIPGTVMAMGDLAYPDGSAVNFGCYDKTWGRVKNRTRPPVGNHEFIQPVPPIISNTSARRPETPRPATTAMTWVPGTSSY